MGGLQEKVDVHLGCFFLTWTDLQFDKTEEHLYLSSERTPRQVNRLSLKNLS